MKEFMLIFRHEKNDPSHSGEEMQAIMNHWQRWISGIAKSGNFSGTNRLVQEGKSIRSKTVTDGPYMEGKEMIGGYLIIKAKNIDEATKIAMDCPNVIYGGHVEVREVMQIDSDYNSANFLQEKTFA